MEIYKCQQCHSNLKLKEVLEFTKDDVTFVQKDYVCCNQKCKDKEQLQRVTITEKG